MDEKRVFNRCLRVGMAVLLGLLLICLGAVKGREQLLLLCLQWENEGRTWQTEGRKLADQWVEFIWNQKIKSRQSDEREGEDWSVLSFLDSLNPWYQRKMQEKENQEDWKEPDPAYRDYLAARDFYIEHSYLIEENPQKQKVRHYLAAEGMAIREIRNRRRQLWRGNFPRRLMRRMAHQERYTAWLSWQITTF